ncbi:MAG: tRNA-dihydrouridine synthase A, partial [Comamonadaceae bacterium]
LQQHLAQVDGVMLGREAYHNPWWLTQWDAEFDRAVNTPPSRECVEQQMVAYMQREQAAHGTPWPPIARHMLGLRHGLPGSRRWRQVWSDHKLKTCPPEQVMALAHGQA